LKEGRKKIEKKKTEVLYEKSSRISVDQTFLKERKSESNHLIDGGLELGCPYF
jgi:hypothetical protein